MGLDMWLEKRKKNSSSDIENKWQEIMYWRKANQIREWFANNLSEGVENCQHSTVEKRDLENLVTDCKAILANHKKAKAILPTSSGFFFGSTDYDEYYYQQLNDTVESLEKIIAEIDWDNEEVAYYEWW